MIDLSRLPVRARRQLVRFCEMRDVRVTRIVLELPHYVHTFHMTSDPHEPVSTMCEFTLRYSSPFRTAHLVAEFATPHDAQVWHEWDASHPQHGLAA